MKEKSQGCQWTDFKSSLCLKYCHGLGWGLVVYDASNGSEMQWVRSLRSGHTLVLGEAFIWRARTEKNCMMLEASIEDSSVHLPVLGAGEFELPNYAVEMVLKRMTANGAFAEFETEKLRSIKQKQHLERIELIHSIDKVVKEFGKMSCQANAARQAAMQKMNDMEKEYCSGMLRVDLVSQPCSCLEELAVQLDLCC